MKTRPAPVLPPVLLPPAYAGSITRYALILGSECAIVDNSTRHDKRYKSTHRMTVVDTRGPLTLTVPLKGGTCPQWSDARISSHGRWQEVHLTTLASAYGRTPYFEFYIDRLEPIIRQANEGTRLVDLDRALESEICRMLSFDAPQYVEASPEEAIIDLRKYRFPPLPITYRQHRQPEMGFIPGLSILDLLFNLGPESSLILADCLSGLKLEGK